MSLSSLYTVLPIIVFIILAGVIYIQRQKSPHSIQQSEYIPLSQNLRKRYPHLGESIDEIDQIMEIILQCRLPEIDAATKPVTSKITWKFQVYLQVVFHRVADLVDSMIHCWNNSRYSCAFILLKALYENGAVLYAAGKKLSRLVEQRDFSGINQEMNILLLGNKQTDSFPYSARNVLTSMDKVTRDFPNHKDSYNHLCEYAHPNFDGMMGLYGRMENQNICTVTRMNGESQRNTTNFVYLLRSNLRIVIIGHKQLTDLFEDILQLSIENLRQQGRDSEIDAYTHDNQE